MWCESIVRNAAEDKDFAGRAVDYVDIQWDQCRSTLKGRSRAGEEIRVLLPRGQNLRHGDVLFENEARAIVINVLPCEVLVVRSNEPRLMAELALTLGNLHWPTQATDTELIFLEGNDALEAARNLGLQTSRESRRFSPLPVPATAVRLAPSARILRSSDGRDAH